MNKIIVIGHKNPDTDTVISTKMFSLFLEKIGKDTAPRICGEINRETAFILKEFKEEAPQMITDEEIEKEEIFLVDHNDLEQSVAKKENIVGILDHHLLSGLKTDKTIFFRVEPIGSTSSLVYKMMKEKGIEVNQKEACLLLAGIISDTLNLNSPTTTSEDIDFYYELKEISGQDTEILSAKMFEAKSDFSGKEMIDIIRGDMKGYDFGGKKIGIAVAETTSSNYFLEKENELVEEIKNVKEKENFHAFFFGVVDIVEQNTYFYPAGLDEKEAIKNVFKTSEKGNYFLLEDITSRKKEIAPPLSEYYEKLN